MLFFFCRFSSCIHLSLIFLTSFCNFDNFVYLIFTLQRVHLRLYFTLSVTFSHEGMTDSLPSRSESPSRGKAVQVTPLTHPSHPLPLGMGSMVNDEKRIRHFIQPDIYMDTLEPFECHYFFYLFPPIVSQFLVLSLRPHSLAPSPTIPCLSLTQTHLAMGIVRGGEVHLNVWPPIICLPPPPAWRRP